VNYSNCLNRLLLNNITADEGANFAEFDSSRTSRMVGEYGTKKKPVLLDVREPWEFHACHMVEAFPIPMNILPGKLSELDAESPIV
jgi:hypothetical protein